MKPRTIALSLFVLLLSSCHDNPGSTETAGWPGIPDSVASGMLSSYSGHFKKGLLTLVINYVSGNTVSGYDLHRGIRRNLNGTIEVKDSGYLLVLKEPGGSPNDGVYYLTMNKSAQKLSGNWVPTDSTLVHSGAVDLARSGHSGDKEDDDRSFFYARWEGDLGTLSFAENNSCQLEYYPDSSAHDSNAQLITVHGNYVRNGDTVLIDWQNNKRMPALHMRLLFQHYKEISADSSIESNLHGNGVKFIEIIAG